MNSDPAGSESPCAGHAPTPGAHVNAAAWTVTFHPSARLVPSVTVYASSVVNTCCSVPASAAEKLPGAPPETVSTRAPDGTGVAVAEGVTLGVSAGAAVESGVDVDGGVFVAGGPPCPPCPRGVSVGGAAGLGVMALVLVAVLVASPGVAVLVATPGVAVVTDGVTRTVGPGVGVRDAAARAVAVAGADVTVAGAGVAVHAGAWA